MVNSILARIRLIGAKSNCLFRFANFSRFNSVLSRFVSPIDKIPDIQSTHMKHIQSTKQPMDI